MRLTVFVSAAIVGLLSIAIWLAGAYQYVQQVFQTEIGFANARAPESYYIAIVVMGLSLLFLWLTQPDYEYSLR
jgi:cell division protein FtsX